MRKLLLVSAMLLFHLAVSAQILCVQCYRQNAPVSTNITNLVLNGGFENGVCGGSSFDAFCPASNNYSCDINNWTCTGGGYNTYAHLNDANFYFHPEGLYGCYMGNWYCYGCSSNPDDTTCAIDSGCIITGIPSGYPYNIDGVAYGDSIGVSITQTVSGLTAGNVYVLEFWSGGEGGMYVKDGIFAVDLGFGNMMLRNPSTDAPNGIGKRYIIQFAAVSSTCNVKFTNWGHRCGTCSEVILDDIRIYPVAQLSSIIPACALEINSIGKENFTVYFNKEIDQLELNSTSFHDFDFKLYNNLSQSVINSKFSRLAQIPVGNLPKGLYIYEIREGNNLIVKNKILIY